MRVTVLPLPPATELEGEEVRCPLCGKQAFRVHVAGGEQRVRCARCKQPYRVVASGA